MEIDIQRMNSNVRNGAKPNHGSRHEAQNYPLNASQGSSVFHDYRMEFPPLPSSSDNLEPAHAPHLGSKKDKVQGKYSYTFPFFVNTVPVGNRFKDSIIYLIYDSILQ